MSEVTPVKTCPFLRNPCVGEKCQLYVMVETITPSPVAGMARRELKGQCAFVVQTQAMAIVAGKPLAMLMGKPLPPGVRGG